MYIYKHAHTQKTHTHTHKLDIQTWSPTIASPGRTTTPPHSMTPLASHGCMAAGPCFAVVEWEKIGKPYSAWLCVCVCECVGVCV